MTGRIAVVGAGIAGLACAAALERAGLAIRVFDKGRVPGGRIATRRLDGSLFDHGAQFATGRGNGFRAVLEACRGAGAAALWPQASEREACWVGVPGMAALPGHLAASLSRPPEQRRHVAGLHRDVTGWRVRHFDAAELAPGAVADSGGELAGPFDAVLLALPAPQAERLLGACGHAFAGRVADASYAPCWAVMAIFAATLDLPDVRRAEVGPIAWLARESSRPGRPAAPERFVIHGSGAWSREHLQRPEPDVRAALLAALPVSASPVAASVHRWRYAKVERALGEACLWDAASGIGACGDWCLGGRVEAAWDSGRALAETVLAG